MVFLVSKIIMEENSNREVDKELLEIEREKELKEQRLKLVSIKKAWFLIAIGKKKEVAEEITVSCDNIRHVLNRIFITGNNKDTFWEDSFVKDKFDSWKQPEFELAKYLGCVKWIYLAYFGLTSECIVFSGLSEAMEYVLAHARNFTEPWRAMFQFSDRGDNERILAPELNYTKTEFSADTPYAAEICGSFAKLSSNDTLDSLEELEEIYQRLNANITYLILLMMRRAVKKKEEFHNSLMRPETHANYVKLCPHPFHTELPVISDQLNEDLMTVIEFSCLKHLVMMAVLQSEDEKTKQILKVTCSQHLEWTGLVFPRLFFKVSKLYNIEEDKFWDIMSSNGTLDSLFELSDLYFQQYKEIKDDPSKSFKLFPYCRLFGSDYHRGMSYRTHFVICYILAYLHDLHFGLDKSSARLAHWTKNENYKDLLKDLDEIAFAIHKKYFC